MGDEVKPLRILKNNRAQLLDMETKIYQAYMSEMNSEHMSLRDIIKNHHISNKKTAS
jgi:predicted transcriptional regulator